MLIKLPKVLSTVEEIIVDYDDASWPYMMMEDGVLSCRFEAENSTVLARTTPIGVGNIPLIPKRNYVLYVTFVHAGYEEL